jgi:hypothetical protein
MEVLPQDLDVVYSVLHYHHQDKMVGMVHLDSAEEDTIRTATEGKDDQPLGNLIGRLYCWLYT